MAGDDYSKRRPCVLFVDAYDSFSENIVALLRQLLHVSIVSIKIDEPIVSPKRKEQDQSLAHFDAVVIGPGPGTPDSATDTGHLEQVWEHATTLRIPVLGICLGFQSLCSRFELSVTQLDLPCHGHARKVIHGGTDIFEGVGDVFATNYNSLAVRLPQLPRDTISASSRSSVDGVSPPGSSCSSVTSDEPTLSEQPVEGPISKMLLEVLAWNMDNYTMAVKHTDLPFWGLQFHPESCLSNSACHRVLLNWWKKVQQHNQEFRHVNRLRSPYLLTKTASDSTASDMEISDISKCLETLIQHCGRKVSYTCSESTVSRMQLANLCQSLSTEGATAMLESSRQGRFNIYAFPDSTTWLLQQFGQMLRVQSSSSTVQNIRASVAVTMKAIERFMSQGLATGGDSTIPFWGGLIGSLSYEAGLDLSMPEHHKSDLFTETRQVPDLSLMWVDRSVVLDNETSLLYVQTLRKNDGAWLSDMSTKVKAITAHPGPEQLSTPFGFDTKSIAINKPVHADYISRIRSCQTCLHTGNSYELCLTASATVTTSSAELSKSYKLYRCLQQCNPAPYSAYTSLGTVTVLSSSPEQFLSWSRLRGYLDMMPMKGTLAKTPDLNTRQAKEMLCTPKEEAENLMIVDLIQHDLHRSLASNGTVTVKSLYELVETENTYQLVSHIRGHIPLSATSSDLLSTEQHRARSQSIMHYGHKALRTSLPPGSMTGAPKIRSCSILSKLEQRNRGVYSGVIGYFDIGGGGGWSVAIRCAFSDESEDEISENRKIQKWHIGAGGAITVLSDEEQEWEEMRVKMDGVLKGFGVNRNTFL